jgi:hypothetical protein
MMALDATERGAAKTSPMQLAHNPLFTAREKIDMLNELKAEVLGKEANPDHLGYDPEEIDAAIAEIRQEVQDGTRPAVSIAEVDDGRYDK